MIRPVEVLANNTSKDVQKEKVKLTNCLNDTEKLTNAVFYRNKNQNKNIFNQMRDEITELKGNEV